MSFPRAIPRIFLSAALLAAAGTVGAQDLGSLKQLGGSGLDKLTGSQGSSLLGGVSLPSSSGNAAGLLSYCIKNKYLGADSGAAGLKDKLLGKLNGQGTEPAQDPSYQQGLQGILHGNNGQSLNLGQQSGGLKQKLSDKVCQLVLKKGSSLL